MSFFNSQLGLYREDTDSRYHTTEDLAQECLAELWRKLPTYRPREGKSFEDYVCAFAWRHWRRYIERGAGGLGRERKRKRVSLVLSGDLDEDTFEKVAHHRSATDGIALPRKGRTGGRLTTVVGALERKDRLADADWQQDDFDYA